MIILKAPESEGFTPKGLKYVFTAEKFYSASIGQPGGIEGQRILSVGGEEYLGSLNPGSKFEINGEHFFVES
ncbi:hypothetical protein EFL45_10660 [Weissella confusa]|uniref:hypothetical protein n=1 Tax=Weissella confusa TaxID=1583 RepID=UPI00223B8857|nr:hypothetical protein [Weissella confusa]MCT0949841.1 hypothetical protein [Weissella confusa]